MIIFVFYGIALTVEYKITVMLGMTTAISSLAILPRGELCK